MWARMALAASRTTNAFLILAMMNAKPTPTTTAEHPTVEDHFRDPKATLARLRAQVEQQTITVAKCKMRVEAAKNWVFDQWEASNAKLAAVPLAQPQTLENYCSSRISDRHSKPRRLSSPKRLASCGRSASVLSRPRSATVGEVSVRRSEPFLMRRVLERG